MSNSYKKFSINVTYIVMYINLSLWLLVISRTYDSGINIQTSVTSPKGKLDKNKLHKELQNWITWCGSSIEVIEPALRKMVLNFLKVICYLI